MDAYEFYIELDKATQRKALEMQLKLFDSNKYKKCDFVQMECWKEAISTIAKEKGVKLSFRGPNHIKIRK